MKNILIFGAGGFANEVILAIQDINLQEPLWNIIGLIDDNESLYQKEFNGYKVLGGIDYLLNYNEQVGVVITVNKPGARKMIAQKLSSNSNINFPNIVHPTSVFYKHTGKIGVGNIIFLYTAISYNVTIGDFNIINSYTGLGHDVSIGDYNTFNPRVAVSGWVSIKDMNEFGMSSSIVQQKKIGSNNLVGAHSLLIRSIKDDGKYFGLPAQKMNL